MQENNEKFGMGEIMLLITFAIVVFLGLSHLDVLFSVLFYVFDILSPLWIGIALAFILNLLVKFFEKKMFSRMDRKGEKGKKTKRGLSIALAFVAVVAFLVLLICFLVPQIWQSVDKLGKSLPALMDNLTIYVNNLFDTYHLSDTIVSQIANNWKNIISQLGLFISNSAPKLLDFTSRLAGGVVDSIMGFFMAVYLLYDKERYIRLMKKIVYAFTSKKFADKVVYVGGLINKSFTDFVTGQLTEAFILGVLCFIGMSILSLPYALLISVLVAVTGVIPILGVYLGTIPSAFIIFMIEPIKALWFVIFILILQQIEGNFIYPRVVGKSIGLGGIWVLLGIIIGGSLGGIGGMFLGVPVMAVAYIIGNSLLNRRLKERNIVVK